jgi:deferrochelatase/peroxidase EfeB
MSDASQSGITNRPPEHMLLAAFSFTEAQRSREGVESTLDALSALVERELNSELDPLDTESGELGFEDDYDRGFLTITLGLASTVYDLLGTAEEERPRDLREIPWGLLEDEPANNASGDIILQVCADNLYVCEHVIRRVQHDLGERLTLAYSHIGSQRYNSRPGRTSKREGRALIGFLDGTSNLDPRGSEEDAKLVFVDPENVADYPPNPDSAPAPEAVSGYGGGGQPGVGPHFPENLAPVPTSEPKWAKRGTYMTVRVSAFPAPAWDAITQPDQEKSVGRHKRSGASLDLPDCEPTSARRSGVSSAAATPLIDSADGGEESPGCCRR